MIVLKQVIHYEDTNSVEATWVDVQPLHDLEIPEVPGTPALYDEAGNLVQEAIPGTPARVETGRTQETAVRCHSYADVQMDMLKADLGDDAPQYAVLIATVRARIRPHPPVPLPVRRALLDSQRDETLAAGLNWNGETWHAGVVFQQQLTSFLTAWEVGLLAPTATVRIRSKANVNHQMGRTEVLALAGALMAFVQQTYIAAQDAKDALA